MFQLHLNNQQFHCLLRCDLYYRFDSMYRISGSLCMRKDFNYLHHLVDIECRSIFILSQKNSTHKEPILQLGLFSELFVRLFLLSNNLIPLQYTWVPWRSSGQRKIKFAAIVILVIRSMIHADFGPSHGSTSVVMCRVLCQITKFVWEQIVIWQWWNNGKNHMAY